MIPYFASQSYVLFGIRFQTWGTFIAAGYLAGTFIAWKRAKRLGLDQKIILDLAFWIFVWSFVVRGFLTLFFMNPVIFWRIR